MRKPIQQRYKAECRDDDGVVFWIAAIATAMSWVVVFAVFTVNPT